MGCSWSNARFLSSTIKYCKICGTEIIKLPIYSNKYWKKRILCSRKCDAIYRTGKSMKKIPMSKETKLKISISKKGRFSGESSPRWKGGKMSKICTFCNKIFYIELHRKETAKFCCKKCHNDSRKSEKSEQNNSIRKSTKYKEWRKRVFERDCYKCVNCGKMGNLHADHIKPFAIYIDERFNIDNGRTLCINCHKKTDTYGYRKIYRKT